MIGPFAARGFALCRTGTWTAHGVSGPIASGDRMAQAWFIRGIADRLLIMGYHSTALESQ
jgi:hypothetical protein